MNHRDILDYWTVGRDAVLEFSVVTGEPITVREAALVGATTLYTYPLLEAVASGSKLRFGNLVVVTTADAAVDALTLSVVALTSYIAAASVGKVIPDISGWALECVIREDPNEAVVLNKTTGNGGIVISGPTVGMFQVLLNRADTWDDNEGILLAPDEYHYTAGRTDAGLTGPICDGVITLSLTATR